jgi:hypothetical protein
MKNWSQAFAFSNSTLVPLQPGVSHAGYPRR